MSDHHPRKDMAKDASGTNAHAQFIDTHWSLVLAAGQEDSRQAPALETLCRTYWPPLYAFVRHRGYSPQEAEDLTQEFFSRILRRKDLAGTSPEKGRFRTYLLAMLKNFLINEWRRDQCEKRGGGLTAIPLDADPIEARFGAELADATTPERTYERHWAFAVLDQTMNQLRQEYLTAGKGELFELLKQFLSGQKEVTSRAEAAALLGISKNAIDVAVHRLRRRYGECLRQEIAHTVQQPSDIDEEIRYLRVVLGRGG